MSFFHDYIQSLLATIARFSYLKNDESRSDSFGVTFQLFSDEFPDDFLSIK